MATTKRTQKEIEKDCKRIKEAAKVATSLKDIERATNLSYAEINTTMRKHPTIFKRIKEQLVVNKQQAEIKKTGKKNQETLDKSEEKARLKVEKKSKKVSNIGTITQPIKTESTIPKKLVEGYVIDASITGIKSLQDDISKICATNSKIILTSITIKELERMQKFNDSQGIDVRHILALAAENYTSFETVLIDETFDTPDDCIVHYCAENKSNVTLLTSDKTMVLKARMYGVKVHYLKQYFPSNTNLVKHSNSKIRTLFPARRIANKLLLSGFHTNTLSIRVYSDGIEYTDGVIELKIGDDVFIASKKLDYITFAHYKMISLYSENNCELIYSKRFYDYNDIDVSKATYKAFLKDFKCRHNL